MTGISYAQRPRSELLARILMQMQSSQAPVQSYGELAARLGAAALTKSAYNDAMAQEDAQKQQQAKLLAGALASAQQQSMGSPGGPTQTMRNGTPAAVIGDIPGDPQGARAKLVGSLLQGGDPQMAVAGLGLYDAINPTPKPAESPFAKIDPAKFTPASIAVFNKTNNPADLVAVTDQAKEPTPHTEVGKATSDLRHGLITPEQYREILLNNKAEINKKLEKDPTIAGVVAPILNKIAAGVPITEGEKQALYEWQRASGMERATREALDNTPPFTDPNTSTDTWVGADGKTYTHDKAGRVVEKK